MKKTSPFHQDDNKQSREAAIRLIKSRIQTLYKDQKTVQPRSRSELIDRFWEQHKDSPNQQAAWQQFYSGLSDEDKHALWNEYHAKSREAPAPIHPTHAASPSHHVRNDGSHAGNLERKTKRKPIQSAAKLKDKTALNETKQKLISGVKKSTKKTNRPRLNRKKSRAHWRPLIISLTVMAFWLLAQYNPLLVAFAKQYISPGDTLRGPVIVDPNADIEIGEEPRIIIPKINVDVPVVYDVRTRDETAIQDALERGVVHYAGTSVPGQAGNNVIVGHSSNNFLNSGRYKFAFVLLDRLELDDTFILHYEGTRYIYKVTNKQVIEPTDFSLVQPTATPTTTLITCTPPGTSWKRLVIQAEQISPSLSIEQQDTANIPEADVETPEEAIVPGNAPSLWQRMTGWLF